MAPSAKTVFAQEATPATSLASAPTPTLADVRVPGEFEPQRAIVLSISDWMPQHYPILQQIVDKTSQHVNVLILYNDLAQLREVVKVLGDANPNYKHVYFSELEMDTIWLRDFGPRLAELDNGWISIDFLYEGSRPRDESFPGRWASVAKTRLRTVRWIVQGGNLISNGAGVAIATDRIFSDNNVQFLNPQPGTNPQQEARDMVTTEFKRSFNLEQLVILEPLQEEATRHADMFATFIDENRVLIARVDALRDPVNAAILDRNAQRLQTVTVKGQPLQVHRIEVPTREETYWSPYTNIILANKLLLMPTFDSDPQPIVQNAIATYQRLLPDHQITTVDMTSMKTLQGSLHCLSLNLPDNAPWPEKYYSFDSAFKGLEKESE
ncbi:MAG: agmatine deiminase family protein [Pirellulaceae bacterium]